MQQNVEVLLSEELKEYRGQIVTSFQSAGYEVTLKVQSVKELITSKIPLHHRSLVIISSKGISYLPTLTCDGIPVIMLIDDAHSEREIRIPNIPGVQSITLMELPFIGLLTGLLREQILYKKRVQMVSEINEKEREQLTTTLSSIGDGVITTDLSGTITFMNKAAEELTDWTGREARGIHIDSVFRIVNEKTREQVRSPYLTALERDGKSGLEKSSVLVSKKGKEYFLSASSSPIKNNDDKIVGVVIVFRDITKISKFERELEIERQNLLNIFNASPISMLILDENCVVKYVNEFFERTFTVQAQDVVNQRMGLALRCSCFSGKFGNCADEAIRRRCKFGNPLYRLFNSDLQVNSFEIKHILVFPDGIKELHLKINAVPLLLHDVKHAVLVIDDVTERRKYEENLKRYQLLSRNANDIILLTDIRGKIVEANLAATQAFGYDEKEILSKKLSQIISESNHTLGEDGKLLDSKKKFYEAIAYKKNGETFVAEVSLQETELGESTVLLAVLRDITERKKHNKELRRAKEAAEAANKAKSEFLANMSHEIRTPLNGLIGMIDLTLLTDITEEQKDNLFTAKHSAINLLNVINDVLDFSKVEAGKLSLESINFSMEELLERILKQHGVAARQKGVAINSDICSLVPKILRGDPHRIQQILNNLVGNAVKFTDSGSIDVLVDLSKRHGERIELVISIKDTGVGIAQEDMDKLFASFSQVDASYTRKRGGTGLGLAISKRFIEKMGGNIWVKSAVGQGSTFSFTLQLNIGSSVAERKVVMPSIKQTKHALNILLVEDDLVNQAVISRIIRESGHNILVANNGIEALEILEGETMDLILMDIQMPKMDGLEATRRIREKEAETGTYTPIVAITAYALEGDRDKFLAGGMDGYISKPIQIDTFLATIEQFAHAIDNKSLKISAVDLKDLKGIKDPESTLIQIKEHMNGIEEGLGDIDLSKIEEQAHEVKQLATELGAIELKNAAFRIELAVRRGDLTQATKYYSAVEMEFDKIKMQKEGVV